MSVHLDDKFSSVVLHLKKDDSNDTVIDLKNIISYWFRRNKIYFQMKTNKNLSSSIKSHLLNEVDSLFEFIYFILETRFHIGSLSSSNINKLVCLFEANKCGLQIPDTLITNTKNDILSFTNKKDRVISKGICETINIYDKETKLKYRSLSTILPKSQIEQIPELFFPSKVQKYIEKTIEIRSFLCHNKLWSMAIFSQSNSKTEIDYRNYDDMKPNRYVPFKLPDVIEKKLFQLAGRLKINTCSFDLILNKNNNYIFLELNPDGQFDFLSYNCNYFIEFEIASQLCLLYER